MPFCDLDQLRLHYRDEGDPSGPVLVLSHALGTDLTLWDGVVAMLPPELRVIRFDTRGHGQSHCPAPPYAMGALIRDAESLLDHLGVRDCVFAGISMGGMIAQGLAVKRLDQIRALVLSNTAARIATAALWQDRIALVAQGGMAAITEPTIARWFPPRRRDSAAAERCRAWMAAQDPQGYIGCMAAIAGTDFYTPTSGLRLPTLGIAGSDDGSTPPDLVRETLALIPGAAFQLMRRTGHLPCLEDPGTYALHLTRFLSAIGHL